jgi:O-antigen/teichoic acid export membrane protein
MISKKFIKSSAIYTIIGAMPLASAFFLLIFYTNFLTKPDYGALVLYISFTSLVQIAMNFGLDTYISISYFDNKNNPQILRDRIGSIIGYLILCGVGIGGVMWLTGRWLFELAFNGKDLFFYPYGLMSVATAFFNSFFKTYTTLLINQERPNRFFWVNLANFTMTLGFSLSGLFLFPFTLIGPMWGRFLSGVGIFIIALISFGGEFNINFKLGHRLKKAFSFSLPVLIFFLLTWLISNSYPFILKHFLTLSDVATFGLALQFTFLVEFILNGLSSAITPKVYSLIKDKGLTGSTPDLNKYFSSLNAISLILIPTITLIVPLMLPIIINKDYNSSYMYLSALNIGFTTRSLYNYFLTPAYMFKRTDILPKAYMATVTIQIAISILLIKYFGIWGAVWANLFTKILQDVMLFVGTRKIFSYRFNFLKLVALPLSLTLLIIGADTLLSSTINIHLLHLAELSTSYLLVWLTYKDEINPIIAKGKGLL